MRTPPCILVVDDQPMNVDILGTRLAMLGYEVLTALDGATALAIATTEQPDLILLDVRLPTMDGLAVCRTLKADATLPFIPIILLTVKTDTHEVVAGFDAGADDYLTKPVDQVALVARVKAMLRVKARHDAVDAEAQAQATQAIQWAAWSRTLEQRLQAQIPVMERLGRLKQFLTPTLAELVVSTEGAACATPATHGRPVVCCTLKGFDAFVATATLAQVLAALTAYDPAVGPAIRQGEGLVEQQTDGSLRVVFNARSPVLITRDRLCTWPWHCGTSSHPCIRIGVPNSMLWNWVWGLLRERRLSDCGAVPDGWTMLCLGRSWGWRQP